MSEEQRSHIEARIAAIGRHRVDEEFLAEAGAMPSGLSGCAAVALVDKQSKTLKQVESRPGPAGALRAGQRGTATSRPYRCSPRGPRRPPAAEALNYITACIAGSTLAEARARIDNCRSAAGRASSMKSMVVVTKVLPLVGQRR